MRFYLTWWHLYVNTELNNLRMIICLRKSDFGVEKFVMSMKNLLSMTYTVRHATLPVGHRPGPSCSKHR